MGEETNDLPYDVFMNAVQQSSKVNQLGWPRPVEELQKHGIPTDAV